MVFSGARCASKRSHLLPALRLLHQLGHGLDASCVSPGAAVWWGVLERRRRSGGVVVFLVPWVYRRATLAEWWWMVVLAMTACDLCVVCVCVGWKKARGEWLK